MFTSGSHCGLQSLSD